MKKLVNAGGPGAYLFGDEERNEVMDVLKNGHLFRYGKPDDPAFCHKTVTFETEFAAKMNVAYAVATTSGTNSLLCCLAALGIGAGDEVIVPGYTFIASISTIMLMNARPVLAEIDDSLNIDPTRIEELITPRTKAIMPVHMLGNPCDMDSIMAIAKKNNLYVIEDCCQACGAMYRGKRVGTFGDMAAFSLNVFKTISSGDGGVTITNDKNLYERAFGFHDQGHKPSRMGVEIGNRSIIGMNMRMNELTGAVALAQLRKIDTIMSTLNRNKSMLKEYIGLHGGYKFRKINDPGECCTILTLIFDNKELTEKFCAKIGSSPIARSGWHVYNNMEQILGVMTSAKNPCLEGLHFEKHMLPQTDDILERAVNISIGVVDKGLGSGYGININSTPDDIKILGEKIAEIIKSL